MYGLGEGVAGKILSMTYIIELIRRNNGLNLKCGFVFSEREVTVFAVHPNGPQFILIIVVF